MIYAGACVVYLVLTRSAGTPFTDSLTDDQRRIKKESAKVRSHAFAIGIALSSVIVLSARPFD
jgi:hypothetical protein